MKFYIDIDDTLLKCKKIKCSFCNRNSYETIDKYQKEIDFINVAYSQGHFIILFTGRGWDLFETTYKQVEKAGIKFHSLIMGKPDGIYIDRTNAFKSIGEYFENKNNS